MKRLLIIGCGDVMRRALPWLCRRFYVYVTVRSVDQCVAFRALGVIPIVADLDCHDSLKRLKGVGEYIIHSVPPPKHGSQDKRTRRLVAALSGRLSGARVLPRRLVYISTTGVYGDCHGAEIDESHSAHPQTERAKRRHDAETILREWGKRQKSLVSILRAPGIYAADRLPFERIRRADPVLRAEEDVYTNHIHADDLARIAGLALFRGRPGRIYNTCDDSQLKMGEYFDLVAETYSLPKPPRVSREEAAQYLSPASLSFMNESRRLSNRRIKKEMQIQLRYPDVFAGLAQPKR